MKEAATKVIDTLTQEDFHGALPEVVGTVQQVQCIRRRLLRRGLEFHVCTINKSALTKKSLETYWMILLSLFSLSFGLWSTGRENSVIWFLLLISSRSDLLAGIKWSVCISKPLGIFLLPFSRTGSDFCLYHLNSMVKIQFLAQFPVDYLSHPIVSSLILPLHSFVTLLYD